MSRTLRWFWSGAVVSLAAHPGFASFHFMEIEQVIAGVNGNTTVQAIQLRTRSAGHNLVAQARILVRDAAGNNPIIVRDMTTNVGNGASGSRVLIATANLPNFTSTMLTPDFTITNPIPASYLAAGTLTFESDSGIVYWRLSWGGANYTGPGAGDLTNDSDGNFNPPYPGVLPTCTTQALQYRFGLNGSTNNANDYQLTAGAATLIRNNGSTGVVTGPAAATGACCVGTSCQVTSACSCAAQGGSYEGNGTTCSPDPCVLDCNNNGTDDALDLLPTGNPGQLYPVEITDPRSIPDCQGNFDQPVQSQYFIFSEVPCLPIEDLNVDLQMMHTWVGDLGVTLTSPQGTTVSLMHRVGAFNPNPCSSTPDGNNPPYGNDSDNVSVIFNDQAAQAIEDQLGPIDTNQHYRPGGAPGETPLPTHLSALQGENPCGQWLLTVQDDAVNDFGQLLHWSLHFTFGGSYTPPFSRDCNFNHTPDECDLSSLSSADVNHNALPDECEPSCCDLERHGDWDGDCDVDLLDYAAFQICNGSSGRGVASCFEDGCTPCDTSYDSIVNLDDILAVLDAYSGPTGSIPGCDPNAGTCDAWATGLDTGLPFGGSYTIFGSPTYPPIPADFFGPGSMPFSGVVEWKGQAEDAYNFGNTDTIIEHPPLRFGFGDLPLCDIVPARIESLSLRSREPIIVPNIAGPGDCNGNGIPDGTDIAGGTSVDQNANGTPDECEWYVAVEKSPIPAPDGVIDGCKTHANGGTFDATIYVQPLFVFVNKAELDSGTPAATDNVKFLDTGVQGLPPIIFEFFDRPFSICPPDLGIYVTPCSEGNFVPGVDTSGQRGAQTTCNSHITPDNSHYFCPPECFEHLCTYPAAGGPLGVCFDADGAAPFCASAPVCPAAPVAFVMPGELCTGPDPLPCPALGFFDVNIDNPGTCAGPDCLPFTTCVQTYGPPITCTDTGILTGDCP